MIALGRHASRWGGAAFFGVVSYWCIVSFSPPSMAYNKAVAGQIFAAAATLFLSLLWLGERFSINKTLIPIALGTLASITLSWMTAVNESAATDRLFLYYAVTLFGIAVYLLNRNRERGATVDYLIAIPIVHLIILAVIFFWLMLLREGEPGLATRFPYHSNIRHFAYHGYLAASAATAVFLLSRKLAATAFLMTAAALFGIVLLGSRGALYSWLAFVCVATIFHEQRKKLLAFSGVALSLAVLGAYLASRAGLAAGESLFARAEIGTSVIYRSAGRWPIWLDCVQAILERPWFGYGPEGYYFSRCCNPRTIQPHNFVLQLLMEFGFIGCALLICCAFKTLRNFGGSALLLKRAFVRRDIGLLVSILSGFMMYAMIDGLLYHAIALLHFSLLVALLLSTLSNDSQKPTFSKNDSSRSGCTDF